MKPHIEQTVSDLREQVACVQRVIDLLERLVALKYELRATLLPERDAPVRNGAPTLAGPHPTRVQECGARPSKRRVAASRQGAAIKPSRPADADLSPRQKLL
jgi:hypothetical protein